MVPVREAINSGAWLHFSSNDREIQFRLRVLAFEKLDLSQVDEPDKIQHNETDAQWWLMKIEAVNLSKRTIRSDEMNRTVLLIDQDGFQFNFTQDSHLSLYSKFSTESGLHRFFGNHLIPKTKAVGTISFRLPDDAETEYSIAMEDGIVTEA
jgi:hypothetical protein